MVQQYNTARGAVEEEEAERALQAAYLQEEEGGGGWAESEWEQVEEEPQQPQPQQQRWQAFQAQEDEVGAWCVLGALCGLAWIRMARRGCRCCSLCNTVSRSTDAVHHTRDRICNAPNPNWSAGG